MLTGMERLPIVSVVTDMAGEASDDAELAALSRSVATQCMAVLDRFGVRYERHVLSAFYSPDALRVYAEAAWERHVRDIIVLSPTGHLAGMLKAFGHRLAVIAVPLGRDTLESVTALLSTVQMPKGAPVAVAGVNNGVNAALLAVNALARSQPHLWAMLDAYHDEAARTVRGATIGS